MSQRQPKVNIIILQYNNAVDTLDCLWSLKNINYSKLAVTIVDNASEKEELDKIKEYLKSNSDRFDIKIIETGFNLGFSGGNNVGVEDALKNGADYVLLLNNDTVVSPDFLDILVKEAEKNPEFGILAPKIFYYRYGPGYDEIWSSGADVKFLDTNIQHKTKNFAGIRNVGYVPGAGMLIRKEVFDNVGYLDEDYFLYYEDLDFCLQVKRAGYEIGCVGDSAIWHKVSKTTEMLPSPSRLRYAFRNTLMLSGRFGDWKTKMLMPLWMKYVAFKQLIKLWFMPSKKDSARAILAGLSDYIFNRVGNIESPKIKVGIECSDLEDVRYGIGKTLIRLVSYLTENREVRNNYAFYLYFKGNIPNDKILKHPIFRKRLLRIPSAPLSFNIFYHIYIPAAYCWHNLKTCVFFPYMLPAFFKGKSIVMLTNDVIYEIKRKALPFRYRLGYGLFSWWAAKRADRIMSLSNYAKDIIAQSYNISPDKIFVNNLGIDKIFDEQPEQKVIENTKRKLGLGNNFITFVGQAFPRRRLRETLLAFKKVKSPRDNLQFLFVGADKYPDSSLQDLISNINGKFGDKTVVYRNRLNEDELRSVYAATKVIAYISTSEAQGLPPMEALKYGTPALLKDYGLSRELFKDNAFYVQDETDVDEITLVMQRALNEKGTLEKIRKKGYKIASQYTWEKCVETLIHEIKQIA